MKNLHYTITLFLCIPLGILAQTKGLKTKSVSVFKNGSAFFVKEGQVSTKEGTYFLENEAPSAAFGTLWFSAKEGGIERVQMHTKRWEKVQKRESTFTSSAFEEMLKANIRKKLTLLLRDESTITGIVEKINDGYFLFNTGEKWMNLRVSDLDRIEFSTKPIFPDSSSIVVDTMVYEKKGLLIDFDSNKSVQDLGMMYMQKGIGWVPAYNIDLLKEGKARLRLHAIVSNQAEDFVNADLNFVVGVPNFIHQGTVSPLSKNGLQSVSQFYNVISGAGSNRMTDFANRGGRVVYGVDIDSGSGISETEGLEGAASEDLFFYNLPDVSMRFGESGQFSILQTEVDVKHTYEVQLAENSTDYGYYRNLSSQNTYSFGENFKNKVWHSIAFRNTTSSPLTSGAVMVTNSVGGEARPISQDKITYTPIGGEAVLKLTVAPDVSVRDGEKQKEFEEKAHQEDGYWYDRVTVEAEVKVQNYKSKKIKLAIRKAITGELNSSNVDWLKVERVGNYLQKNTITDVCWELDLKPGEKKTITYTYSILVRR